ncbi:hypothetical protein ACH5RR_006892 [Cinchona calisaya]|uniref:Uncharacterized protein n=1 Tax=Cinchona calisaya TaxID=153742 RepID=A0ABD3AQ94_9GENT
MRNKEAPYWEASDGNANETSSYIGHGEKLWDQSPGHRKNAQNDLRVDVKPCDVRNHDFLKMQLFPYSLVGNIFEWNTSLPLNLIEEWYRVEDAFHQQFYHCQPEVKFTNLA